MNLNRKQYSGFTIIELLVVVAIIGLLSSVVVASMNASRKKARDLQAREGFAQISKALTMYYDEHNAYPNVVPVATNPWRDNFTSMVSQLIAGGYLPGQPTLPTDRVYNYYNYNDAVVGALLVTSLNNEVAGTDALYGSCRPFTSNWCSYTLASNSYCVCHGN